MIKNKVETNSVTQWDRIDQTNYYLTKILLKTSNYCTPREDL